MTKRAWLLLLSGVIGVTGIGVTAAVAGSGGRDARPAKAKPAARTPQRAQQAAGGIVSRPVEETNAGAYWTPERMKSAQPREQARPGGSPSPAGSSPDIRGASAGSSPTTAQPVQKPRAAPKPAAAPKARKTSRPAPKKTTNAAAQDVGIATRAVTDDAADYWTPERMEDAAPRELTTPGGDGSESEAGDTGIRGATVP